MAHVEQTFRTAVAGAGAGQWRALLERSIDAFVELHERDFAARAVLTNMQLYGEYAEADQAMSRAFIVTTAALVRSWAPSLDDGQEDPALQPSKMLATVIIQTVSSMLIYSQSETPAVRVALFEHCKSMICGYLEPFLGGSPG
nr:hypothetical protein [Pseudenhygromyxa sp. WMMC2535]